MLGLCLCLLLVVAGARASAAAGSAGDDDTEVQLAAQRAAIAEDNPAELWTARGEAEWRRPAGPAGASLENCDLGLGPGVVRGAYAHLPRWFADARQVMDIEQRLLWCMQTLQGMPAAEAERDHFGSGARQSRIEALVAWIAERSRGVAVDVPASHPEEQRMLALGERLFRYRAGSHDFACASCHGASGLRIRLQTLARLDDPAEARAVWASWPAYRLSQGELRTMQHRLYDCLRQQRLPEPRYASPLITALSLYLAHQAQGAVMAAPAVKR